MLDHGAAFAAASFASVSTTSSRSRSCTRAAKLSAESVGATILGDGRVVLILDVAALFEGRRHLRTTDREAELGAAR